MRDAGYGRSKELLRLHKETVARLAEALAEHTELDQAMIEPLLASP
jgi:HD-GYP domain-containing protein (c-di-GMP phosphodiesterase class II)